MSAPSESLACLECRERISALRGLCRRCYFRLVKLVKDGGTTWKELEEVGRARPAKPPPWGRKKT